MRVVGGNVVVGAVVLFDVLVMGTAMMMVAMAVVMAFPIVLMGIHPPFPSDQKMAVDKTLVIDTNIYFPPTPFCDDEAYRAVVVAAVLAVIVVVLEDI